MVSAETTSDGTRIIIRPNRSSDWRTTRYFLLSVCGVAMVIGIGFAAAGGWMVLPFAGLEVAAVSSAFYYVQWKLSYQQVLTMTDGRVHIDKGVYKPRRSRRLPREHTSIAIHPALSPNGAPQISLCSGRDIVEIGEFLSIDEGQVLLRELRGLGLRVRDHGDAGKRRF